MIREITKYKMDDRYRKLKGIAQILNELDFFTHNYYFYRTEK